jgi:pyruvate kinase
MSKNFAREIESIIAQLQPIRLEVLQAEQHFREELDCVYSGNLQSARNLVHYLSLRRHDIRELQQDLGRLALSSLGRLESHVIATLDALLALLHEIAGKEWHGRAIKETFAEFDSGSALLEKHTIESLGEAPADRNVRIMVTMPSEAASDPNLVRDFLNRGMNIMRINCSHDTTEEWLRMLENLRAAKEQTGKGCKITFDLAGPKLRTGALSPSPGIIRWKPLRNELGQVTTPAYVAFCKNSDSSEGETIAIQSRVRFFGTPKLEISLNSPIPGGASAPWRLSKSTNHPAFARMTVRATSSRERGCVFSGRTSFSAKTKWALCRKRNTPFLLALVTTFC